MKNQRTILRCTAPGEAVTWLPRERCALLCEDMQNPPEGYGAYLPADSFAPGDFIAREENGDGQRTLTSLMTADRPERTLFLTGQCNSNCAMCPYATRQRVHGEPMPIEELLAYVELMNPEADYVCLTGGEPTLLGEGFLTVLGAVRAHFKCALVHILTNGRTFAYPDFFEAYHHVRPWQTLLGIPLHAANAEAHDRISGARGSFEQTARGLRHCLQAREHVELRVVTSALNAHQLGDLAHFIGRNFPTVNCVCLMGLEMMGNAMIHRRDVWLGYDQLMPRVEAAADILLSYGIAPRLFNYPLCKVNERYHAIYHRSITPGKVRYKPECAHCAKREACGGFFQTTIVMPDIAVRPYAEEVDDV